MPIVSGGGGGGGGSSYTAPITREQLTGNNVSIANGAQGTLTWNSSFGPDVLLSRVAPDAPTVVTAGVYAVSVQIAEPNMTAGGSYLPVLTLDLLGEAASLSPSSPAAVAGSLQPSVALSLTYYIPAGGTLGVFVTNQDGANTLNFKIVSAIVQRLS